MRKREREAERQDAHKVHNANRRMNEKSVMKRSMAFSFERIITNDNLDIIFQSGIGNFTFNTKCQCYVYRSGENSF